MPTGQAFTSPERDKITAGSGDIGFERPAVGDDLDADTGAQDLSAVRRMDVEPSLADRPPATSNYEIPRGPGMTSYFAPSDPGPSVTGVTTPGNGGTPDFTRSVNPTTGPETVRGGEIPVSGTRPGGQYRGTPPDTTYGSEFGPDLLSGPLDDPSFALANDVEEQQGPDRETEDADTTPIFDSVSAWFQRRSPAPALPTRRSTPPPSPVRRPAPTVNRGPSIGRGDSRPSETLGRLSGRGGISMGGETTRPGSPFPAPGRVSNPAASSGPNAAPPESPIRADINMGIPPVAPVEQPRATPMVTSPVDAQPASPLAEPPSWSSAGDAGWQAAEAAREPAGGGTTRAGLPMRVPMTHLVPGSAESGPRRRPPETPTRSPEAVGGRLASFYQGVRQGRDATKDAAPTFRRDAQEDM